MRLGALSGHVAAFGLVFALAVPGVAAAKAHRPASGAVRANVAAISHGMARVHGRAVHSEGASAGGSSSFSYGGGGISCVPFARENSGIELSGNAGQWWYNAEGVYQRGARPEVGSVLNFRSNGRMRLGHVAVVTNVVDGRNIQIDHANWAGPGAGRGRVSRNISVVDVSEANDWSAVRVALGHSNEFGSVYPTFGFIYDRADKGTMLANAGVRPMPALSPAPTDLRPMVDRLDFAATGGDVEEVAEAPDDSAPRGRRFRGTSRVATSRHGGSTRDHAYASRQGPAIRGYVATVRTSATVAPHKKGKHRT